MSTGKARSKRTKDSLVSKLRNWKFVAIIAGAVAIIALVVVLVLARSAPPDDNGVPETVLATVNGEAITTENVTSMQQIVFRWDGVWMEASQVLEQLISQTLLFREAERRDYVPNNDEVEIELITRLAILGIPLEELYAMLEDTGITYQEFLEYRKVQLAITALLDDEIEMPEVTEEEVMETYEQYREDYMERYDGREPPPFEEMQSLIVSMAQEAQRQDAIVAYVEEMRDKAEILYM
jgi:hypothetical protein